MSVPPTAASPPLPLRHCYWVVPGLLLAGEHPGGPTRDKTKDRLKKLLAAGIECFVDLTKPTELQRYDTHLPFYVEYTRKSIKDHGLPGSREQMLEILEHVGNLMRAGRPVYVHCRAGIGRTGTVIGCMLVERGLAGEAAIVELNRLWQQSRRSKSWPFIPETEAQATYVREWKPGLTDGGFGLSSLAAAVADDRPSALAVAGVQARAATQATGAGQARAAVNNLAAGKGRKGAKNSGAGYVKGAGLTAAASQARAAVERGEVPAQARAASARDAGATGASQRASADRAPSTEAPRAGTPTTTPQVEPLQLEPVLIAPLQVESLLIEPMSARSLPRRPISNPAEAAPDAGPAPNQSSGLPATQASALPAAQSPGPPAAQASNLAVAAETVAVQSADPTPAVDPDPLLDPATLEMARQLRERFVGALFGLAVGDAVAAATQFRRPGTFTPVGDMIGGGPFDLPRGGWTDDTAMALCLAESLLESDGFNPRDQVERYGRWQQEGYLSATGQCVGITASTARSLAVAKWRRVVFPGSHDPEHCDPEPLSRVAAIALFYFASVETTMQQAADSSRTTCQAPAVVDACRRLGRAMHSALSGHPKERILADGAPSTAAGAMVTSAAGAQTNNTATSALAAAFWAFSSTDNFRDAILRAANVGGNSDVVAAVCGQLAGAHYGQSAIPPSWRNGLMQKDLIEAYADRMLAHGLISLSS